MNITAQDLEQQNLIGRLGKYERQCLLQLVAKILHNGSESGSVTLTNQIHFSSRVQLQLVTPEIINTT